MSIRVLGPSRASSRRSTPASSATQPAVGPRFGRATWTNTALPRPAMRGRVLWSSLDDEVVQPVVAPQPVAWFIGRPAERPVVAPVGRVLAPGDVGRHAGGRAAASPDAASGPAATTAGAAGTGRAACRRRLRACSPGSPERPSTTGIARWPASSTPQVRRPGRVRTRISGKAPRRGSELSRIRTALYKGKPRLLFWPRMLYFAQCRRSGEACPEAIGECRILARS